MRGSLSVLGLIALLGFFAGLCAVFALIITAGEAWWWVRVESWPDLPATIEKCSIDLKYYNGPDDDDPTWLLECQIRFGAGTNQIMTAIYSGIPRRQAQGYPGSMDQWANDHPSGSTIVVRYDPTNPKTAIPACDYMPNGGPRIRANLVLLLIFSAASVSLLTIVMLFRRRITDR